MALVRIAVALAICFLLEVALVQASTVCNPLKGKCPNDKGLGGSSYAVDFTKRKSTPENWTVANYENITYGSNGAEFAFKKRHDAPSMWTDFKFWYGRIEVVAQGAPGLGIISSMVLLSDDLDEIDWEMKGAGGNAIGTNYWGKGILDYTNNVYIGVSAPNSAFHTYTLDWSPSSLVWEIDGGAVRNLTAAQAGDKYPQSPMKLCLSVWDGGDPSNPAGTIQWAGGVTTFPPPKTYSMYVKSAKITNSNPAAEYEYTDRSGNASSIKVIKDTPAVNSSSTSTQIHTTSIMPSVASSLSIKVEGTVSTSKTMASSATGANESTTVTSESCTSTRPSSGLTKYSSSESVGKSSILSLDTSKSSSRYSSNSSTSITTIRSATPTTVSTSNKILLTSPSMSSKLSSNTQGTSTTKIIYTSVTTFPHITVATANGETSQQVISVTSTEYSTSTATVCPRCSSNGTEAMTLSTLSHSSPSESVSSLETPSSSTSKTSPSSRSSSSITTATSSAAPPMAPVLLAALKPTSVSASKSAISRKISASKTTTSGTSTTTFLLTSTSTRTHSLLLWGTNGTSIVAASTGTGLGSIYSASVPSPLLTTSAGLPSSTTNTIVFTADTSKCKPGTLGVSGLVIILSVFLGPFFLHLDVVTLDRLFW